MFDAALVLVPRIPRRVLVAFARLAARAGVHIARRDRRIALANLRLAFGPAMTDAECLRVLRSSFECFALTFLDYFWFARDSQSRLGANVTFDPEVLGWVRKGQPFIVVTAHFGNWEVPGKYSRVMGAPLASVAKPVRNLAIDARVNELRARLGQVVIPRQGALRAAMRVLKQGGIVALLLDQDTRPSEGGVFVPFFGVPVPVSSAAAVLAQRMGVPIVPVFCRSEGTGHYHCYAREALLPDECAGLTVEALTGRVTAIIEREIRAAPGQWLWTYKRWKRRQPGVDPAVYPFYADC